MDNPRLLSMRISSPVSYGGSTPATTAMESTPLLTENNMRNLSQEHLQVVFSRFVHIIFLLGCCSVHCAKSCVLGIILLIADLLFIDYAYGDELFWYYSNFTFTLSLGGIVPLIAIVPLLACCCCLGIKRPRANFHARVTFYISIVLIGSRYHICWDARWKPGIFAHD